MTARNRRLKSKYLSIQSITVATMRIQMWCCVLPAIAVLMGSVQIAQCQYFFPGEIDFLNVDKPGRIYVGNWDSREDCHYRFRLPEGSFVVSNARILSRNGRIGVSYVNGQKEEVFIPKETFEKVDWEGLPCSNGANVQQPPDGTAAQAVTSISVSNDADSFALTCDGRFSVVVGANSATPVSLVDLDAGAVRGSSNC